MPKATKSITLSCNPEIKTKLEELAMQHGCVWGYDNPNISLLLKQIAEGKIKLQPPKVKVRSI